MQVSDLAAWLTGLGVPVPVLDGYFLAPAPDRAVFVTITGGAGSINERTFDRINFTVRSRGLQRLPDDAAALAAQVDGLILAVRPPTSIGGVFVNDIDRVGAPPRFADRDSAFRSEWLCVYTVTAARATS